MKLTGWLSLALVIVFILCAAGESQSSPELNSSAWIDSALRTLSAPTKETERWTYLMNVKIRLLLFWVGADDVGGGYIEKGSLVTDPSSSVTQLVIGSDPEKAPRKINHWGSATEIHRNAESVFFGFMKSSKAASAKEAESETSRKDAFGFEGTINFATATEAFSKAVPLSSTRDFTFRDLATAQETIVRRAKESESPTRKLSTARAGCVLSQGFLAAVELLSREVATGVAALKPVCYVHNARFYTLTVKDSDKVKSRKIKFGLRNKKTFERTYKDLIDAEFEILNTESGGRTQFNLLLGTTDDLVGVPVQIRYQPNFWFQVVLNLDKRESF